MAFEGSNTLYVAGAFPQVGHTKVDGIARVVGGQVHALPGGPTPAPPQLMFMDLRWFDNRLYAAGLFTNVGPQPAAGLAAWDGTQWSVPLPGTGVVFALEADAHGLLVAGRFHLPGSTNPVGVARWTGSSWVSLNSTLAPCTNPVICGNAIDQVVAVNGLVYATVQFGLEYSPMRKLVCGDPSGNWSHLVGPDGHPYGVGNYLLARFGDKAVAAGSFTNAADPALKNIATYNGTNWLALGEGLPAEVLALAASQHYVYAACWKNGDIRSQRCEVLRWDGTNWTQMGEPLGPGSVYRIFVGPAETVYVTGLFGTSGDQVVPGLARWSGSRWEAVLTGEFYGLAGNLGSALGFARYQERMVVGGSFAAAGGGVQSAVAVWRGVGWEGLGGSNVNILLAGVGALISSGSNLYVGGRFDQFGGAAATNVACWNGLEWSSLAGGMNGTVYALAWWQDSLIAGGRFDRAGGIAATNIARWQEGQWFSLSNGCNSNVNALAVWQNDLYAAGRFTRAGTTTASRIARWDGINWHPLGAGLGGVSNAEVRALAAGADGLYVAGRFTLAGGQPITNIARWDGTGWFPVGTPPSGEGQALAVHNGDVFLGTSQTDAQGLRIGMIYHWDGTRWSPLGSGVKRPGVDASINAIFVTEHEVFVGGGFTFAGGKPSVGVARWIRQPQVVLGIEPLVEESAVHLRAWGDPGLRLRLEASPDLVHWTALDTNLGGSAQWLLPVNNGAASQFFRTRLVP